MSDPIEGLARELWEAYATRNQEIFPGFDVLHFDQLELFQQDTWRMLAGVALVFRPKA